nr:MAG TPA: hypothetical protein [Caudoviricetes sp.]
MKYFGVSLTIGMMVIENRQNIQLTTGCDGDINYPV